MGDMYLDLLDSLGNGAQSAWGALFPRGVLPPPQAPAGGGATVGEANASVPARDRGMGPPSPEKMTPWELMRMDPAQSLVGPPTASMAPQEMPPPAGAPPMAGGGMPRIPTGAARTPVTSGRQKLIAGLGDDDYSKLAASVQNAGLKSLDEQRAGIDALQQRHDQINANPYQTDLSPLMALADQWQGGNSHLAQSYQHPETPEERRNLLLKMEEQIQGAKGAVSKDDIDLLKSRLTDQRDREAMAQRSQDRLTTAQMHSEDLQAHYAQIAAMKGDAAARKDTDLLVKKQDHFNNDESVKSANSKLAEAGDVQGLLDRARTMPGQQQGARVALATMFTKRLNERELKAFTGDMTLEGKLDRMFTTGSKDTLTDSDYKALSNVVSGIKTNAEGTLRSRLDDYASQHASATGGDVGESKRLISGGAAWAQPPAQAHGGEITPEQAKAELARRAAAKGGAG